MHAAYEPVQRSPVGEPVAVEIVFPVISCRPVSSLVEVGVGVAAQAAPKTLVAKAAEIHAEIDRWVANPFMPASLRL